MSNKSSELLSEKKSERLSGYDFRAWEKFDADKAAEEVENEDKKETEVKHNNANQAESAMKEKALKAARRHEEELEQIREQLKLNELSELQLKARAGIYVHILET